MYKRSIINTSQAIGSKKSHIAIAELKLINPLHQETHSWNKPRSIFFSALPMLIQSLMAGSLLLELWVYFSSVEDRETFEDGFISFLVLPRELDTADAAVALDLRLDLPPIVKLGNSTNGNILTALYNLKNNII